jgi:glycosyltransferase involved in cell wall biosynthesis
MINKKFSTVSVVIPIFNASDFIFDTLTSILTQSVESLEVICVDDGSTDNSTEIVSEMCKSNERLKLMKSNHRGSVHARNVGIEQLSPSSKYVVFFDHDDVMCPDALQEMISRLEQCSHIVGVHGLARMIGAEGEYIDFFDFQAFGRSRYDVTVENVRELDELDESTFASLVYKSTFFPPGVVMLRKSTVDKLRGFNQHCHYAEDWDYFLRALTLGNIGFVAKTLVLYRRHDNNMGATDRGKRACAYVRSRAHWLYDKSPARNVSTMIWRHAQRNIIRDVVSSLSNDRLNGGTFRECLRVVLAVFRYIAGCPLHPVFWIETYGFRG